jgi:ribonucleoside-diphosphate reductase alpha chain
VPNSPQWFNTGLHESYGITGGAQGHYYVDPTDKKLKRSTSAYERPQPHACFILSVSDDLVNEGGIMDLWTREARIFKYGSGVGTNFSQIRGANEKLSGGGSSSGLMSFLKIGDRAAGAIKSGGTTRRAAKMVCLDLDHPEIMEFINWKVKEEDKVAALIAAGYDNSYEGEAYATVSGQNSNNSVRIPNSFFKALSENGNWELKARTDGRVMQSIPAREVWDQIANAAWRCADPGTQYDTTINEWHTCPKGGRINASNPCSEYMFLDNTACNLASINLRKFFNESDNSFDVDGFEYTTRLWQTVLEVSILINFSFFSLSVFKDFGSSSKMSEMLVCRFLSRMRGRESRCTGRNLRRLALQGSRCLDQCHRSKPPNWSRRRRFREEPRWSCSSS